MLRKKLAVSVLGVLFSTGAFAGGGGMTGGATEITQLMNNAELVSMVGQQADMAATQIQQYILQQVQTKIAQQHLIGLPFDKVMNALGPYGTKMVQPYLQQYNLTTQLRDSAYRASTVMSTEIGAMTRLNLTPTEYSQKMIQYSKEQGGYYRQAVEQDMAALQDVQQRGQAWAEFQKNIPNINSEIGGLQTLATSNAHMVGEMQSLNATLIQMKATEGVKSGIAVDAAARDQAAINQNLNDIRAAREWQTNYFKSRK